MVKTDPTRKSEYQKQRQSGTTFLTDQVPIDSPRFLKHVSLPDQPQKDLTRKALLRVTGGSGDPADIDL